MGQGVQGGADHSPLLIEAIKSGKAEAVRALLANGADPNAREALVLPPDLASNRPGGEKKFGDTALILAVQRYNMDMVRALLARKADVNGRGQAGWTPLISASGGPNLDLVKLLLANKADPNLRNAHGATALEFAANTGTIEIVRALLDAGAKPNLGSGSPLLHAAETGHGAKVDLLFKRGADPNKLLLGGLNVYEVVVRSDHFGMAERLRKAGGKGRSKAELDRLSEDQSKRWVDEWERENRRIESENPTARNVTEEDRILIEMAVLHLMFSKDSDFRMLSVETAKKAYLVDETSYFRTNDFSHQIDVDLGPDRRGQITLEMRKELRRRNTRPVSLKGHEFSSSLVLTDSKSIPNRRSWFDPKSEFRGYAYTYLPGFSSDRTLAVIRLGFGPTPHGASATYFFEKTNSRWMLKWSKLAYYV